MVWERDRVVFLVVCKSIHPKNALARIIQSQYFAVEWALAMLDASHPNSSSIWLWDKLHHSLVCCRCRCFCWFSLLAFFPVCTQPLVMRWKTNACRKYLEHFAGNVYAIHKHICHCNSRKKEYAMCIWWQKMQRVWGKKVLSSQLSNFFLSFSLSVVVVVDKHCNKLQCSKSAPEHKTATNRGWTTWWR